MRKVTSKGPPESPGRIDPKNIKITKTKPPVAGTNVGKPENVTGPAVECNSHATQFSENQAQADIDNLISDIPHNLGVAHINTVAIALFQESNGSSEGFMKFDDWHKRKDDYQGLQESEQIWEFCKSHPSKLVTLASLREKVTDRLDGNPPISKRDRQDIVTKNSPAVHQDPRHTNPLEQFSLTGKSAVLEADANAQGYLIQDIVPLGQTTMWYSPPNYGKTLLALHGIAETVSRGEIAPHNIYYFNNDDHHAGLIEKVKIAEELDIHLISPGFCGYKTEMLNEKIAYLCDNNIAAETIIILDTVKRNTDLMSKRSSSIFSGLMRQLSSKGGTFLGLAHTNKHRSVDGELIFGGTADLVDDFDCVYVLDEVNESSDCSTRLVEFKNIKRRGMVANSAVFNYSCEDNLTYEELLASVKRIDPSEIAQIMAAEEIKADSEIIKAIISCLGEGVNSKMAIRDVVSKRIGISKRQVIKILEKYQGSNPELHEWAFSLHDRGKKVYQILEGASDE